MITKLSINQQKTIYGGGYYCIFDDGAVLVVISSNEHYLYPSWEEAKLKHPKLPTWMIKAISPRLTALRKNILLFSHIN